MSTNVYYDPVTNGDYYDVSSRRNANVLTVMEENSNLFNKCKNCSVILECNGRTNESCHNDTSIPGYPVNRDVINCLLHYCAKVNLKTLRYPSDNDNDNDSMHICPCISPLSEGRRKFSMDPMPFNITAPAGMDALTPSLYTPEGCFSRQHLAIIVPYRNRDYHLRVLLPRLSQVLRRQQAAYRIFVIEQRYPTLFNKASLMNIGYVMASGLADFDCFIFHDVDFIAEDDRHRYWCSTAGPVHLGAYHDRHKYTITYGSIFGGVTAFTRKQFVKVNGFSNRFYGWGGEDDDMSFRLNEKGYTMQRDCKPIAGFKVIGHQRDEDNKQPNRTDVIYRLFHDRQTDKDGINNMKGVFTVVAQKESNVYTHILVDIRNQTEQYQL